MLHKLSLSDLTYINGGQIYEFFDEEKEIHYYFVPSADGPKICHNKTEALTNLPPLAKKGVISCWNFEEAKDFAKTDSDFYRIAKALNKGGKA